MGKTKRRAKGTNKERRKGRKERTKEGRMDGRKVEWKAGITNGRLGRYGEKKPEKLMFKRKEE